MILWPYNKNTTSFCVTWAKNQTKTWPLMLHSLWCIHEYVKKDQTKTNSLITAVLCCSFMLGLQRFVLFFYSHHFFLNRHLIINSKWCDLSRWSQWSQKYYHHNTVHISYFIQYCKNEPHDIFSAESRCYIVVPPFTKYFVISFIRTSFNWRGFPQCVN